MYIKYYIPSLQCIENVSKILYTKFSMYQMMFNNVRYQVYHVYEHVKNILDTKFSMYQMMFNNVRYQVYHVYEHV